MIIIIIINFVFSSSVHTANINQPMKPTYLSFIYADSYKGVSDFKI